MESVAVVGGGHNGLVAACYLAQAGLQVTVLERRTVFGGLACAEELFPGCRVSSLANRSGMLRRSIIRDLNLERHGFEIFRPVFASHIISNGDAFTFSNGTQGDGHTFRVSGLTNADLEEWHSFWGEIEAAGAILASGIAAIGYSQARFKEELDGKGHSLLAKAIFQESLYDYAKERISHPSLLSAILTMSGSHPFGPSSLFEVIYYCTAESFGEPAAWGYVRGGMGALIDALLAELQRLGVTLIRGQEVTRVKGGDQAIVVMSNGDEHKFGRVVLATDPVTAYGHLLCEHDDEISSSLSERLNSKEAESAYGMLHLKLHTLPNFPVLADIGRSGSDLYSGAFDFSLTPEKLAERYEASRRGELLILPNLSCNVFSSIDDSVTGGKGHVMSVLIQACDAKLRGAHAKRALYDECLATLTQWSPGLSDIIEDYRLITPEEIENVYGVRSGCCLHLRSSASSALDARPFPEVAGYRTPIRSVYLTGAGSYPGGCVSGAPGQFCAQQLIRERGEDPWK